MKWITLAVWLLLFCAPVLGVETNIVTYATSEGLYVMTFVYSTNSVYVPTNEAGHAAGCPHYAATITVRRTGGGVLEQVGEPFRWVYTRGMCYEDKPSALLYMALNNGGWHRPPEME